MGYNIPISVSAAESFSVPQSITSPSYIIFGNARDTGGDITPTTLSYDPATAVSSAALGNAGSTNQQSQLSLQSLLGMFQQHKAASLSIALAAIVLAGVGYYYWRKHR